MSYPSLARSMVRDAAEAPAADHTPFEVRDRSIRAPERLEQSAPPIISAAWSGQGGVWCS